LVPALLRPSRGRQLAVQRCKSHRKRSSSRRARASYTDVALLLLERGADVNRPNQQTGCTMLLLACQKGYTDVVRLCLERGADVHQMDASGQPPLAIVCKGGHRDSARLCLAHGADVDQVDYLGMGPLHYACIYNRHDAVRGILDHGAAVDGASPQQTPLWVTCLNGHVYSARLLAPTLIGGYSAEPHTISPASMATRPWQPGWRASSQSAGSVIFANRGTSWWS